MNTLVQFFIIFLSSLMLISIVLLVYYVAKSKKEISPNIPILNCTMNGEDIHNKRLRSENESIFEAALLGSSYFANCPQSEEIYDVIRSFK